MKGKIKRVSIIGDPFYLAGKDEPSRLFLGYEGRYGAVQARCVIPLISIKVESNGLLC